MDAKELESLLLELEACPPAQAWAQGKTLQEAWAACLRGDWLLWLAGKMEGEPGWHTRQQIVLAACACAETMLQYIPAGEDRPRQAIEVARRWAEGGAEIEEVRAAAYAAAAAAYHAARTKARKERKELSDIVRRELPEPLTTKEEEANNV